MKHTLHEIVDVILERLQERADALPSETGIRTWLTGQGYAKRDIEAAMKMVRPRFVSAPHVIEQGPGTVRKLTPYEDLKLTVEARDALARLDLYKLLSPAEREAILDRLDHFEGEVGLSELDYLVTSVAGASRDVEHQQTLYNVMEGKGETLH